MSARLEYYRQEVLRDVTARGQADVKFCKILDNYRKEVELDMWDRIAKKMKELSPPRPAF